MMVQCTELRSSVPMFRKIFIKNVKILSKIQNGKACKGLNTSGQKTPKQVDDPESTYRTSNSTALV